MTSQPETVVYLPPEVCGCLSVAEGHLKAAQAPLSYWRRHQSKVRRQKHQEKVQKLVAKAARMLANRGEALP